MKKYLILCLIVFPYLLFSQVIAKVEQYQITNQELQKKIREIDKNYSYTDAKKIALHSLINEKALLIYANQNRINVTEQEIESFFVSQFGEHPSLQTGGFFDYEKFLELKNSERGQTIIKELEKDLLKDKTKTMIMETLDISDEALLEKFVLDNVRIDIRYALMDLEEVAIDTFFTPQKAVAYFQENPKLITANPKLLLEFHIIRKSAFYDSAFSYQQSNKEEFVLNDSISQNVQKSAYFAAVLDSLWKHSARKTKEKWLRNEIDFPIITLELPPDKQLLSPKLQESNLLYNAQDLEDDEIGQSIQDDFIILYKKKAIENAPLLEDETAPKMIWKSYIEYAENNVNSEVKRDYFNEHFEDYIVPAAIVSKILIPDKFSFTKRKEIIEEISSQLFDETILSKSLSKYNLEMENEIVYLEKFKNSEINQKIADSIKNGDNWGVSQNENRQIMFRFSTLFPEYIPDYTKIRDQILITSFASQDTTGYFEYYQSNPDQFFTPDSIQIGGAFVPVTADTVSVENTDLLDYYERNKNFFIRDKSVQFDYLFLQDESLAKALYLQTNPNNFQDLKTLFHKPLEIASDEFVEYKTLPENIQLALSNCLNDRILSPLPHADGWILLWKKQDHKSGLIPFEQVKNSIRAKLQFEIANQAAFQLARTIFDSTRYFSHCYQYAPQEMIFKTKLRNINDAFDFIGELQHKDEFLRLWNNEKYSSIMEYENGYAIVFLLQRKAKQKLEFKDSIDKITTIFKENNKLSRAMTYANYLRSQFQNGENPDSLFYFFGGWKEATNLSLKSAIPGISYSNLILENIIKHDKDYLSPVLHISEEQLLLYHISDIRRVQRQMFYEQKGSYKNQIMQERYEDWLQKFKSTLSISVY
jgi:hypothetical protein